MSQLDLFDRHREPMAAPMVAGITAASRETSGQAARRIESQLNALQLRVLEHLRAVGGYGATDEEMQFVLGMNPSTQRPRRIELLRKGLIRESDIQRTTRSGRNAVVWCVVEAQR